ncbi:hypothetical protein [Mesorhizobium sp.]|uniref:hypothetical protein n=1 Tax=Mesorhizobium sp. TaxID=1871066 RepID=UPI0025FF7770|nr:hypothetical protein [Mesorhizobium sp.]
MLDLRRDLLAPETLLAIATEAGSAVEYTIGTAPFCAATQAAALSMLIESFSSSRGSSASPGCDLRNTPTGYGLTKGDGAAPDFSI